MDAAADDDDDDDDDVIPEPPPPQVPTTHMPSSQPTTARPITSTNATDSPLEIYESLVSAEADAKTLPPSTIEPLTEPKPTSNEEDQRPTREANTTDVRLTPSARSEMEADIRSRCPTWPPTLVTSFTTTCAPWLSLLDAWGQAARQHPKLGESVYECNVEKLCHGLGDRIAGLQQALSYAIATNRTFRVKWNGLGRLFTTCIPTMGAGKWAQASPPLRGCAMDFQGCAWAQPSALVMDPFRRECEAPTDARRFVSAYHACLAPNICPAVRSHFPLDTSAASVFGCPIRALLEPRPQFLAMKFPWQRGPRATLMPLKDILADMAKYYVIAVHFRVGDEVMRNPSKSDVKHLSFAYRIPFRCAETVMNHVVRRPVRDHVAEELFYNRSAVAEDDATWTVDGRPVRFLIASDSEAVREMATAIYGTRAVRLNLIPKHIALMPSPEATFTALAFTFAEWLLLSHADAIVLNRFGDSLFEGRISAFPKTAWAYGLKHEYFDALTCERRSLPVDGNWVGSAASERCMSDLPLGRFRFPQPHLEPLSRLGVAFPKAFVRRGEVVVRS